MATEQDWAAYGDQATLEDTDTILARTSVGAGVEIPGAALIKKVELASSASGKGAALVAFKQSSPNAISRNTQGRLSDKVSAFDFIPENLHNGIRDRTGTTDVAIYIQSALDWLSSNWAFGGRLHFPAGRYYCTTALTQPMYVSMEGDGPVSSQIYFPTDTHGIIRTQPVNVPTQVHNRIEGLWIEGPGAISTKHGVYDSAGTEWALRDCILGGWRHGLVMDQSEIVRVEANDFTRCDRSGIWIVNGPDLRVGTTGGFTNQIAIEGNQFNDCGNYSIIDDGGIDHHVCRNNYNGAGTETAHLRVAGVTNLNVLGGEWEGSPRNIQFATTTLYGVASVGATTTANVAGNLFTQSAGVAIEVGASALNWLDLRANYFGASSQLALITGVSQINAIHTSANHFSSHTGLGGGRTFLDNTAPDIHDIGEGIRQGAATWDPASIANGAQSTTTITVDCALGDFVDRISFSGDQQGLTLTGYVSAANTVTAVLTNQTGAAVDLVSGTVRVVVRKRTV